MGHMGHIFNSMIASHLWGHSYSLAYMCMLVDWLGKKPRFLSLAMVHPSIPYLVDLPPLPLETLGFTLP